MNKFESANHRLGNNNINIPNYLGKMNLEQLKIYIKEEASKKEEETKQEILPIPEIKPNINIINSSNW